MPGDARRRTPRAIGNRAPILLYLMDVRNTPSPSPFVVLKTLELRHFRNLGIQELHFPAEGVAVVGDNAQGKTNLLEAIYYLESFRSFRGATDAELTAFNHDVFYVRGDVAGGAVTTVAAGFDRKRKSKRVTVDGSESARISAALGSLGAVAFSPADVELVNGGPGVRRRFLDLVLSLNQPGYLSALQRYRKWLAQRNAALRASGGQTGSAKWVRAWDGGLVETGAAVTCMRAAWATAWGDAFSSYHDAVSGGETATLAYKPHLGRGAADHGTHPDAIDEAAVREHFSQRLDAAWEDDLRRGATGVGPHRDELLLTLVARGRSLPLRTFGSGGQRRTAALALRLTEAATIRRQRGTDPVLLVDDAFAELDGERSRRVMALLESELAGQVIVTAPKDSDVRFAGRTLERWHMHGGAIEA